MANLLYAWELGANLGHVGAFLPLARMLRERGHGVHWAVADVPSAARLLDREGFAWLQAPRCPERLRSGQPLNYADILLRFGFGDADDLLGLTVAWRELLRLTDARLVLADHAPSAILAARTLDVPVMLFGHGFFAPPPVHPTPDLRPWTPTSPAVLGAIDAAVIANINAVLERFGKPPVAAVAELFQVAEAALMTFPELDHYSRGPAQYWGTLPTTSVTPPPWPQQAGPRMFVYLRPDSPHCIAVLQALQVAQINVLAYVPGLPEETKRQLAGERLYFLDAHIDLNRAAREADAAVTYAGMSTTAAFLLGGKPLLILPGNLEQYLLARRVESMGTGLLLRAETPVEQIAPALERVLSDPSLAGNAQAFARKYAAFSQDNVAANLVRRIEELCP